MRRTWIALGAMVVALTVTVPAPAAPPGGVVVAHFYTFAPGDDDVSVPVLLTAGTELHFLNLDGAPHSVTAATYADDGTPLFDSGLLPLGGSAPVTGSASLAPGDYAFVCSAHPFLMRGTLRVVGL